MYVLSDLNVIRLAITLLHASKWPLECGLSPAPSGRQAKARTLNFFHAVCLRAKWRCTRYAQSEYISYRNCTRLALILWLNKEPLLFRNFQRVVVSARWEQIHVFGELSTLSNGHLHFLRQNLWWYALPQAFFPLHCFPPRKNREYIKTNRASTLALTRKAIVFLSKKAQEHRIKRCM